MRKVALLIILFGVVLSLSLVSAALVAYYSFEGYSVLSDSAVKSVTITPGSTSTYLVKSSVFSLTQPKWADGIYVHVDIVVEINPNATYNGGDVSIKVTLNGKTVISKTYSLLGSTTSNVGYHYDLYTNVSAYNSTFTVNVYASSTFTQHVVDVTVTSTSVYTCDQKLYILSKLPVLNYIPPGAAGTTASLLLNYTQVKTNVSTPMNEGAVAFWLKWDGTNITLLKGLNVTTSPSGLGNIVLTNDQGTTYKLTDSVPVGKWVPVYISWESGLGYIMVNTTKITLNWAGNWTPSFIGNITQKSGTLIDEVKIWNTYIPPDLIVYELASQTYYIKLPNNLTLPVQTDEPSSTAGLGTISVTFLSSNFTALNTTTLTPSTQTAVAPPNTTYIMLSRDGVERLYYIPGIEDKPLAFPPVSGVQLQLTTLTVYPPKYDTLEVWTMSGKLAARYNMVNKTYVTFTAIYGKYYKFVVREGNYTYSIVEQVQSTTLNLKFPEPNSIYSYSQAEEKLTVKKSGNTVTLIYVAPQPEPVNLTIKMYGQSNNLIYEYNETQFTQGFMKTVVLGSEVAYMTVDLKTPTYTTHRVIANTINFSYLIPEYLFPNGLRIAFFGLGGLYVVGRKYKYLAPFTALLALTVASYIKIVSVSTGLMATLTAAAALALITRRGGNQ